MHTRHWRWLPLTVALAAGCPGTGGLGGDGGASPADTGLEPCPSDLGAAVGTACQENGKLCVICPERCPLASSCYDGLACRATRWISVRVDYFDPLVYCDGGSDFACPDGGTCDRRCLGVVCPIGSACSAGTCVESCAAADGGCVGDAGG